MQTISIAAAFANWQELSAELPQDDFPMLSESWNDYTDSLTKDGQLTALQYHYCPAFDDTMPEDDARFDELAGDREFILDAMGVEIKSAPTDSRADAESWGKDASHWRVTIARNGKRMTVAYSMGSAHTGEPELADVLSCLLSDANAADESFYDWCADLGYDTDSRKALRDYRACKATAAKLARLFTAGELDNLHELFADR